MTCNRFRTLIQQRFDQDLTTQDHRALINHLEGCESCAKFDHQLDQMIQAAQDTPAPDEVRPQNPEALARLIMEQLPQKKGSLTSMIMGLLGGFGGGKARAPKQPKMSEAASSAIKGGSSAIKEKSNKLKGKDKASERELEPDRRPGGVTFGQKRSEHIDNEAIESQVGTFSRLKSISNRAPEPLDRDAQSTTRSLGEKFGMQGASPSFDEGPLTLAESIKRKVSESQKISPLEDDDASGALTPMSNSVGASGFGRPEQPSGITGGGGGGESSWGSPGFSSPSKPAPQFGAAPAEGDKMDWGGGSPKTSGGGIPNFASSTPVGFDEHPGSSIGLAPPGSKRPMDAPQPGESGRAGIGLAPAAGAGAEWGSPKASVSGVPAAGAQPSWAPPTAAGGTAGGGSAWGGDNAQGADASSNWGGSPAPAAPAAPAVAPAQNNAGGAGWTSGWGGDNGQQPGVPLKSSDSWAVPGSESTNSWGQPSDAAAQAFSGTSPSPTAQQPTAAAADAWAPPGGAWGGDNAQKPAAPASSSNEAWGAAVNASAAAPAADPWGSPSSSGPAPAVTNSSDSWGAVSAEPAAPIAAAPAQSDAWGSAPAANSNDNFAPAQTAAQADAWGSPAQSAPAAAPAQADAWGSPAQSAPAAAPAQADAWGSPAQSSQAAPANNGWGAPAANQPAPAPAQASGWGAAPAVAAQNTSGGWGNADAAAANQTSAPATPATEGWGSAPAQPSWGAQPAAAATGATTGDAPAQADAWGAPAAVVIPPSPIGAAVAEPTNGMAAQYSTIPPGQFATPANAGTAIASSGWGGSTVPPSLDAAQIEAKKNAWAAEAEQLETGTWRAFAPKMGEAMGAKPPAMPSIGAAPSATPSADRWDVPIQERAKTGEQTPIGGLPVPAVPPPIAPMQPPAAAGAQNRWDVPIQERARTEEAPAAPAAVPAQAMGMGTPMGMPPGSAGSPVMSSGIPVNQIVEKMGQVLGGSSSAASTEAQESRWDVPIQERMKGGQVSQEMQTVPVAAPAAEAPVAQSSGWGQPAFEAAPAPAPMAPAPAEASSWGASNNSGWGQEPAAAPVASSWDAQPAAAPVASAWDAQPPAPVATPAGSGWDTQPAAPANNGGWGAGDSIPQPVAQPTSTWGQPAGSSWGDQPAAANQPAPAPQASAPVSAAAWGSDNSANNSSGGGAAWGQPPAAPAANGWANAQPQASAPPEPAHQPPSVKPEVTDKVQAGGLLTGIDDKAIDKIFGEIGVQESVSKTLVNSGAEPVSNFSPPQTPAPQPMAAPMPAPAMAQAPAPEVPKGLLGGIDDNAIDRIFSQNLGVSEPSVPVGRTSEMTAPAAGGSWSQPQPAPAAAAPMPVESAPATGGWGAPPAASGWGQPPALPVAASVAESAPAAAVNTGWGMAPAAPGQWGQPPAEAAPVAAAPAVESGPPKLFSVDDSVMDRIFADNLGIPKDGQPAANAGMAAPQAPAPVFQDPQHRPSLPEAAAVESNFQGGPPPKIEGIGRLDASADQNQDAGSGRIASIGKFLLDQKDLDKIGKLTTTDFNDSKLRILTKENSDDLQALLGQIGTQKGVIGSVIVGHDGLLIANTMPGDMDAESVGVWALGVYMNTEHVTKKMGHDRVHQVVSRTPRGYVIIADFGGGLLVTVTEGKDTDSLIPLMRTITQLVN